MNIKFNLNPDLKGTVIGEFGIENKQHLIVQLRQAVMVDGVLVSIIVVKPNAVSQEQ